MVKGLSVCLWPTRVNAKSHGTIWSRQTIKLPSLSPSLSVTFVFLAFISLKKLRRPFVFATLMQGGQKVLAKFQCF